MLLIIAIMLLCLMLVLTELKPLYSRDKKAFWVYAGILAAAFLLWVLAGLDVEIPVPV